MNGFFLKLINFRKIISTLVLIILFSENVFAEDKIIFKEVVATGIDWNFAPCLAIPQDPRWGRYYEGFSEDTELVSRLGIAAIKGYQNKILSNWYHFIIRLFFQLNYILPQ